MVRPGLIAGAIFIVVAAVFSAAIPNDFVRYDDFDYIVANKALERGVNRRLVRWAFLARGYASNYHPLTWISHAADVTVARVLGVEHLAEPNKAGAVIRDKGAFPHLVHAINVLLHAVNAVLLWWLIMGMVGWSRSCASLTSGQETASPLLVLVAAGCALLWALHPLRVEVVAWASERKELLCTFFMLLTLIAWVRRGRSPRPTVVALLAFVFYALALLAKPMAVSLPVVLFAWEWLLRRASFKETLRRIAVFFVASAFICHLTMISQGEGLMTGRDWTLGQRVLCAVEAPVIYVAQTFWPANLSIDYTVPDWTSWPAFVLGAVLLLVMGAVSVLAGWMRFKARERSLLGSVAVWLAFAVSWMYIALIPVLGLVKVGYEPHSDRYTYWAACGAAVVMAKGLVWLYGRYGMLLRAHWNIVLCATALILLVLSGWTVQQCRVWFDSETLFTRVVHQTYNEHFARSLGEGIVFKDRNRIHEVEDMLRTVLQEKRTPEARAALALHLAEFGKAGEILTFSGTRADPFAEARLLAGYALEEPSRGHDWAYAALAFADYREEKFRSAIDWMEKAQKHGFKSTFLKIDLDEWAKKAEEKERREKAGTTSEDNVRK